MTELTARLHATAVWLAHTARPLARERGQGTVEYVGLILLVAIVMTGMVAAIRSKSFPGGGDLAEAIVNKIVTAVKRVKF